MILSAIFSDMHAANCAAQQLKAAGFDPVRGGFESQPTVKKQTLHILYIGTQKRGQGRAFFFIFFNTS